LSRKKLNGQEVQNSGIDGGLFGGAGTRIPGDHTPGSAPVPRAVEGTRPIVWKPEAASRYDPWVALGLAYKCLKYPRH
jgi:hypothetical protein